MLDKFRTLENLRSSKKGKYLLLQPVVHGKILLQSIYENIQTEKQIF